MTRLIVESYLSILETLMIGKTILAPITRLIPNENLNFKLIEVLHLESQTIGNTSELTEHLPANEIGLNALTIKTIKTHRGYLRYLVSGLALILT